MMRSDKCRAELRARLEIAEVIRSLSPFPAEWQVIVLIGAAHAQLINVRTKRHRVVKRAILTVPADWIARVYNRGLSVADGSLTLDYKHLPAERYGVDLLVQTWTAHHAGGKLVRNHGGSFMAVYAGEMAIGVTAEEAVRGATREFRASLAGVKPGSIDLPF